MAKRIRLSDKPPKTPTEIAIPHAPVWTAKAAREYAFQTGEMPHLFLLRISRGEIIEDGTPHGHRPTLDERIDCAKACAQYFVPKLGSLAVKEDLDPTPRQQMVFNEEALEGLTPDELDVFERVFGKLLGRGSSREGEDLKDKKQVKAYTRTIDLEAE